MCDFYPGNPQTTENNTMPLLCSVHSAYCVDDQMENEPQLLRKNGQFDSKARLISEKQLNLSEKKKRKLNQPGSPNSEKSTQDENVHNLSGNIAGQISASSSCSGTSSSANSFSESHSNQINNITDDSIPKTKLTENIFPSPKSQLEDENMRSMNDYTNEEDNGEFEGDGDEGIDGYIGAEKDEDSKAGKAGFSQRRNFDNFMSNKAPSFWNDYVNPSDFPNFIQSMVAGDSGAQPFLFNSNALATVMANMSSIFGNQANSQNLGKPQPGPSNSAPETNFNPMLAAAAVFANGRFPNNCPGGFLGGRTANSSFAGPMRPMGLKRCDVGSNDSNPSPLGSPMRPDSQDGSQDGSTMQNANGQQWTFEEQFKQLYELSDDPKRREFLDDLFSFMQRRGTPVNRIPIMAKQVLDLHALYQLVVSRGGLVEVINKKLWREITKGLNLPSSITSAAFTLRTQYMKYLYPYECEKLRLSNPSELQSAIDGNRREARRASYNFDYPLLLPGGEHLSPNGAHQSVSSCESGSRLNGAQNHMPSAKKNGEFDFGALFNATAGFMPHAQSLFQGPKTNGLEPEVMINFLNRSSSQVPGVPLIPNSPNTPSVPAKRQEVSLNRSTTPIVEKQSQILNPINPKQILGHSNIDEDVNASEDSINKILSESARISPLELLRKQMSGIQNENCNRDDFAHKMVDVAQAVSINSSTKQQIHDKTGLNLNENNHTNRRQECSSSNDSKNVSGSFNLINSPSFRIYTQPGVQLGLPNNTLVMGLEIGGCSYRGVLFAQNGSQDTNKAIN